MKKPIVNSNHYLALGVSACIFLFSGVAFVFVYLQVEAQMSNTSAAYGRINQAQSEENQAHQVVGTLSAAQSQLDLLNSFFIRDDQTVAFINQIETVGGEAGSAVVTIASISDDDLSTSAAGTTGTIRAHINIQGTWPDAMRAFHLVESLPYGESIDSVRVTPTGEKDWSIGFDLTAVMIHE